MKNFIIYKLVYMIFFCKSFNQFFFMFNDSAI